MFVYENIKQSINSLVHGFNNVPCIEQNSMQIFVKWISWLMFRIILYLNVKFVFGNGEQFSVIVYCWNYWITNNHLNTFLPIQTNENRLNIWTNIAESKRHTKCMRQVYLVFHFHAINGIRFQHFQIKFSSDNFFFSKKRRKTDS